MAPKSPHSRVLLVGMLFCGVAGASHTAFALTAKECHAKFQDAKKAGTLLGQKYKEFKVAVCGDATPAAARQGVQTSEKNNTAENKMTSGAPRVPAATVAAPGPSTSTSGNVVFPTAISASYANLSAGKARMRTCLDQYHANKSSGANGSLRWIQKGGGYYSECNAKLK